MAIRVAHPSTTCGRGSGQPVRGALTANVDPCRCPATPGDDQLDAQRRRRAPWSSMHCRGPDRSDVHAVVALQIAAEGIDSNSVTGSAKLDANGPREAR
jgi:hypothetical protein